MHAISDQELSAALKRRTTAGSAGGGAAVQGEASGNDTSKAADDADVTPWGGGWEEAMHAEGIEAW